MEDDAVVRRRRRRDDDDEWWKPDEKWGGAMKHDESEQLSFRVLHEKQWRYARKNLSCCNTDQ